MTFKEQFPSLKGKLLEIPESMKDDYGNQEIIGLFKEDLEKCCIDKQKVMGDCLMCEHKRTLISDLGFKLCRDCDVIIDTPSISDLAYAEVKTSDLKEDIKKEKIWLRNCFNQVTGKELEFCAKELIESRNEAIRRTQESDRKEFEEERNRWLNEVMASSKQIDTLNIRNQELQSKIREKEKLFLKEHDEHIKEIESVEK